MEYFNDYDDLGDWNGWNYLMLSASPDITIKDVLQHPRRWCYNTLSRNPGIKLKDVLDWPKLPWSYRFLSGNPSVTFDEILSRPELPWNFYYVSYNPNITIDIVLAHSKKNWSFDMLSQNKGIKIEDILARPELPWCYDKMLLNPNFTFKDLFRFNISLWPSYYDISSHIKLTKNDIVENLTFPWNYKGLLINESVVGLTPDQILRNDFLKEVKGYKTVIKKVKKTIDKILTCTDLVNILYDFCGI